MKATERLADIGDKIGESLLELHHCNNPTESIQTLRKLDKHLMRALKYRKKWIDFLDGMHYKGVPPK